MPLPSITRLNVSSVFVLDPFSNAFFGIIHVFLLHLDMSSTSSALFEAFQWSELVAIFLVQAAADIESRALLALIVISLSLSIFESSNI